MSRSALLPLLLTALSLVFLVKVSYGQNSGELPSHIQIVSVYVLPGFISHTMPSRSIDDFNKLAPGSKILNQDFSEFDKSDGLNIAGSGYFAPALGIRFNQADGTFNNHFLVRAGISFSTGDILYKSAQKSTRIPYDTLVSTITGEVVTLDSIQDRTIIMSYAGSALQLDVAVTWSTDFEARFQVYGGVGISAGLTFNNTTTIGDYDYSYDPENPYDRKDHDRNLENYSNKSGFSGNVYLPLGLDWRLGKQGFLESIHFVSEFRPGLAFYTIPELDSYVSPSFGFLMGLKVGW